MRVQSTIEDHRVARFDTDCEFGGMIVSLEAHRDVTAEGESHHPMSITMIPTLRA